VREIKFRAWDKTSKSMIYQEDGKEGIEFNFGGGRAGVIVWNYKPHLINGECVDDYEPYHIEDFELMQYTGLKDKNGKEIYEGDICEIQYYHDPKIPNEITVCKYITEHSGFSLLNKKGGIFSCCFKTGGNFGDKNAVEIIGNIYENPELLKN